MKPSQELLGKLGPYGALAKQGTELLDHYKNWHNAEQAKEVAESVKAQAKRQIEALADASRLLGELDQATKEVQQNLNNVLELMRTYPQRCLDGAPVDTSFARIGELGTPKAVRTAVYAEAETYDDCNLNEMLRLLALLNLAKGKLETQMTQKSVEIMNAFSALNESLGKFEGQLPSFGMKDAFKAYKDAEGFADSLAKFDAGKVGKTGGADLSGSKPSDFLPFDEVSGAIEKAKAADAVKKDANSKLDALKQLIADRDDIMDTLLYLYGKQRELQENIRTWEERCQKQPVTGDSTTGLIGSDPFAGTSVRIGSDSPEWCQYREGTPETFTPGGTSVPPGGPPGTTPGGGTPPGAEDPGDTPGGGPGTVPRPKPGTPCEEELALLNNFMEMHGEALRASARTNAQHASDLQKIEERIRELEEECPPPSTPPGDGPPGGGTTVTGGPSIVTVPRDEEDEPDDGDPTDTGEPTVVIYVKAKSTVTGTTSQASAGQQVKLFADSTTNVALPGPDAGKPQTDHDQEPIQGVTDNEGNLTLLVPGAAIGIRSGVGNNALEVAIDTTAQSSVNAQVAGNIQDTINALPGGMGSMMTDVNTINGKGFLTFTFPTAMLASVQRVLVHIPGVIRVEINFCRDKQAAPDEPLYQGDGAWGQKYDNQWAIKRVGLTDGKDSAWNKLGDNPEPVTVAVIDTGLDWNHLDFSWDNLWRNPGETPGNGIDDDGNGYVDDVIGWDFFADNNKPWDYDGHGTMVTGIIAADSDNGIGIAGINPHARIMVLKALNSFGHTRASYLAKAIVYAVDNGARIINMSVGGQEISTIENEAVDYAVSRGVLVIIASGNEGLDVSNYGIAALDGVITVAATDLDDRRAAFSNWGAPVDIAAPGLEVLGLRARRTDTMRDIPGVEYENGANYVGRDKRYYRASGTSFAAPIVAGIASLILSKNPELGAEDVKRLLLEHAEDIDMPGIDQHTGYGLVDARASLAGDPDFYIRSEIERVEVVQEGERPLLRVLGTANADRFENAILELGEGTDPEKWKRVLDINQSIQNGVLGDIDANEFRTSPQWTLRLITRHQSGKTREFRFTLNLG